MNYAPPVNPYQPNFYQPLMQSYQSQLNQMQNQMRSPAPDIVKVNGRNGAEMLNVPPRGEVLALDTSRNDTVIAWYIKTDDAGYKTMQAYSLTPIDETARESQKWDEIEKRLAKIEDVMFNAKPAEATSQSEQP